MGWGTRRSTDCIPWTPTPTPTTTPTTPDGSSHRSASTRSHARHKRSATSPVNARSTPESRRGAPTPTHLRSAPVIRSPSQMAQDPKTAAPTTAPPASPKPGNLFSSTSSAPQSVTSAASAICRAMSALALTDAPPTASNHEPATGSSTQGELLSVGRTNAGLAARHLKAPRASAPARRRNRRYLCPTV